MVFNENKTTTLGFLNNSVAEVISTKPYNENKKYNVKTFFVSKHRSPEYLQLKRNDSLHNNFITFDNKTTTIVDKTFNLNTISKFSTDILLLSDAQHISPKDLIGNIETEHLVIDSSNPYWITKNWKKELDSLNIPYHDVNEAGAFILKF